MKIKKRGIDIPQSINRSQFGLIIFRFKKNKLAMVGLFIILLLMTMCLAAPLYINYDLVFRQSMTNRFITPNAQQWFGTDQFGRDLFARIIYGGRISLVSGLVVVGLCMALGLVFGGTAGYFGGRVDDLMMRICDIFMAVPRMLLAMAVVTALGSGTLNMLIALAVGDFAIYARVVRASIMNLRNQEYVEAAKCCGTSSARIIFKHLLPNGMGPVIVTATLGLGGTILAIATLGFLGIGVAPPTPEWGTILSKIAQTYATIPT